MKAVRMLSEVRSGIPRRYIPIKVATRFGKINTASAARGARQEGSRVQVKTDYLLQFFAYSHLPPHLQAVSKPFCDLAFAIVGDDRGMSEGTSVHFPLPSNPERTTALRKLLEAKDCAVRAALVDETPTRALMVMAEALGAIAAKRPLPTGEKESQ